MATWISVEAVLAIIDAVGNPDWQTEAACDAIRAEILTPITGEKPNE